MVPHIKCPLLLSDPNQNLKSSINFKTVPQYQVPKIFASRFSLVTTEETSGRTDMAKLTGNFCSSRCKLATKKLEKQSDADHLSPVSVCCLHIRGVPTGRLRSPLLVKLSPNNSDIDSLSCYGVTKNLVQSCSNLSHLAAF
jgi:hypothetical protein